MVTRGEGPPWHVAASWSAILGCLPESRSRRRPRQEKTTPPMRGVSRAVCPFLGVGVQTWTCSTGFSSCSGNSSLSQLCPLFSSSSPCPQGDWRGTRAGLVGRELSSDRSLSRATWDPQGSSSVAPSSGLKKIRGALSAHVDWLPFQRAAPSCLGLGHLQVCGQSGEDPQRHVSLLPQCGPLAHGPWSLLLSFLGNRG